MPTIRYEGRYPDADASLTHKRWADDAIAASAVTPSFVNGEVDRVIAASNLQTTTYVDAQDALLAKIADFTAADNNCLDATTRGVTVAPLDGSGMVTANYLPPGLITERVIRTHVGTASFSGTLTSTTTTVRERKLATVSIPDPGFPYLVLPFGNVTGYAGATPEVYPWTGNGVCGLFVVCPPAGAGEVIYGLGGGTDSTLMSSYPILPYAASGSTPLTRPAVTGALTLDLYGSCFQGTGYVFSSSGLSFYVLIVPAI